MGKSFVWAHIPNEGNAKNRFQKSLMQMGRIPGAPDYFVLVDDTLLFLELKHGNGNLSDEQRAFRQWCGPHRFHVARDIDEVIRIVTPFIPKQYEYVIPDLSVL
jgi:hypothetical protein